MNKPPEAQMSLTGLPTPTAPRIAPDAAQRPLGCHLDHTFRELCPFISAGRAPECAPCPHWDPDWAVFEAACARIEAGRRVPLIPKKTRKRR